MRFPTESERNKRARLLELLDGGVVLLNLDPRVAGVDLPLALRDQPAVALNLSRNYGLPVLEIGPTEIRASLSFSGERYLCVLPYEAVFCLTARADGQQVIFPESLPPELRVQVERAIDHAKARPPGGGAPSLGASPAVPAAQAPEAARAAAPVAESPEPARGVLRAFPTRRLTPAPGEPGPASGMPTPDDPPPTPDDPPPTPDAPPPTPDAPPPASPPPGRPALRRIK